MDPSYSSFHFLKEYVLFCLFGFKGNRLHYWSYVFFAPGENAPGSSGVNPGVGWARHVTFCKVPRIRSISLGGSCSLGSLPEFPNFKLFGKTSLVVNTKFGLFLANQLRK